MQYRVTIEERWRDPDGDRKYPNHEEVFQQVFEDLDVRRLAAFLNMPQGLPSIDVEKLCDQSKD